jgi:hypothetical protein
LTTLPQDAVARRLPAVKPTAAVLRLCLAVGLATRLRVGRWVAISDVFEMLPAIDRADDDAVITAAVASGLVAINTGPTADSIRLTEAGLAACWAAARD